MTQGCGRVKIGALIMQLRLLKGTWEITQGTTGVRQGRLLCCYHSSGVCEKYAGAERGKAGGVAMQVWFFRGM